MMNFGQTPDGNGGRAYPVANAGPTTPASTSKEIPYDHVAVFKLQGIPGNRVEDVINISVDGAFVATAVGYSFIPAQLPLVAPQGTSPIPRQFLAFFSAVVDEKILDSREFLGDLLNCWARNLCHVDFRYNIIDSGTGRELQNRPIHNIAGLGEPNGERPFRPFAKPVLFQPRSTIRIVVEEMSKGKLFGYENTNGQRVQSELNIVLHGYKILGYGNGQT
jgi:hypothetical protein